MPQKASPAGNKPADRVFLIDSMSHIFRAFYAPLANRAAPLANSKGQVTQAVFIFTNMLRKLLQDEQPKYIAAIFESGEKTFRHETFTDYKANRLEMPDDLASQLPYIMRLCEAYNVPTISRPGFEADDVIGTLAVQAAAEGLQAVIVSNDKDMCQLVRDPFIVCMRQNSQVIKRKEPVPPIEWCDEAWVEKKFGVPASQLVDLLGLMGDSIDNIPGAPGIGAKGAVQIIQQLGSIENALKRWEDVKHKTYRESLRNNAELIRKSRELAQIKTDVDVQLDLEELQARPPDLPMPHRRRRAWLPNESIPSLETRLSSMRYFSSCGNRSMWDSQSRIRPRPARASSKARAMSMAFAALRSLKRRAGPPS